MMQSRASLISILLASLLHSVVSASPSTKVPNSRRDKEQEGGQFRRFLSIPPTRRPIPENERPGEINRRFVRHVRALLRSRRRLDDPSSPGVTSYGDGGPWARRLVCEPGCLHGGICQLDSKTKEPMCLCPLPDPTSGVYYRGRSCQTEAVRCNSTWWCENGGACQILPNNGPGEQNYGCSCPAGFQGLKCQTPVTSCGGEAKDLWCANGGVCVFSVEANSTICKCPSTHAGTNCETLVEPQDLGPSHHSHTNFTSPVVLPPDSDVVLLEEEQQHYFKAFFLIFGVFLTIWVMALAVVHCPRPRNELKRRIAALRGELTPLRGEKRDASLLKKVKVVERLPTSARLRAVPEGEETAQTPLPVKKLWDASVGSSDTLHPETSMDTTEAVGLDVTPDASDRLSKYDSNISLQGGLQGDLLDGTGDTEGQGLDAAEAAETSCSRSALV